MTWNELGTNSITASKVQNNSLAGTDITDESLTSADLGVDSVQASEVADGSIGSGEIVDDSLGSQDLASGSVGTSEIGDGAVANSDLADNAVSGTKISNNSLTLSDIAGANGNGAISLAACAVASGRCKPYDITIGGAKANEGLLIMARADLPAGIMIYGQRVPADGHGTMVVCNLSGAAMPALTDFPIHMITFG